MPISAAGRRSWRAVQHGFSLLEMLVTVAVIAIATTMVGVNVWPDSDLRALRQDGQRLAQLFAAAHAEARRDGAEILWKVDGQGYAFLVKPRQRVLPAALQRSEPVAATRPFADPSPLRPRTWSSPNAVTVDVEPAGAISFNAEWTSGPQAVELYDGAHRVRIERAGPGQYRVQS
ncbi:GspH/FimT family pseudopilin [Bordetella sp. 02P26C-1]|uniref:GspH/FimT family pseudopilin n=1 Tax=Bordetella sp. 02P26C-1 TaxID=2683195 RepID=UPI002351B02A|nr:GspH/FimT family pseudopilin [Bordetella sp. 02P26C-1]